MSHAYRRALATALVLAFTLGGAVAADEQTPRVAAAQAATPTAVQAAAERAAAPEAAQAPAPAAAQPAVAPEPTARSSASKTATPLLALKPVDPKTLSGRRGGADVLNDMKLRGVVSDNRAVNVTTGNNVISDGAFAGTTGLPMVVQNTGNNVLIQNATIVNVQVK
ncbi:MAG TPA: hypothetical protein VHM00_03875 [Caldimonas sp.]|jgi:nucleoid-associated protein YgaU|nr:hypothetical protein [Caldimonas sp.]HEX2540204.1 hypothetical protein [Caldimonas sp.]